VTDGVLVMAYGTPKSMDEVEAYYTDIRRGRPPSPELLEELKGRYRAIGGRSPLLEITEAQTAGVGRRLGVEPFLGQKHAPPFIPDAVRDMQDAGITRAAGLVLAPHYSSMSVGDYERRARSAFEENGWEGDFRMIGSWHLEPGYIDLLAKRVGEAIDRLPRTRAGQAVVIFSAHSLPVRIIDDGDPYPDQLRETARAVAGRLGSVRWQVGWQSAGRTEEPWIGPDIQEVIRTLATSGVPAAVICPCGFVSDHLEVLYDVDIEAQELAEEVGISLERTASPNDDPAFLDMLATVVRRALD
jgi:ferrochelatase